MITLGELRKALQTAETENGLTDETPVYIEVDDTTYTYWMNSKSVEVKSSITGPKIIILRGGIGA